MKINLHPVRRVPLIILRVHLSAIKRIKRFFLNFTRHFRPASIIQEGVG